MSKDCLTRTAWKILSQQSWRLSRIDRRPDYIPTADEALLLLVFDVSKEKQGRRAAALDFLESEARILEPRFLEVNFYRNLIDNHKVTVEQIIALQQHLQAVYITAKLAE